MESGGWNQMGCMCVTRYVKRAGTAAPILYVVRRKGHKMKRKYGLVLSLILLLMVPTAADAQLWTGIIDPSRAIDWSKAGIPGGIPNLTTMCATLNPGAPAAQLNSAIPACPSTHIALFHASPHTLTRGLAF